MIHRSRSVTVDGEIARPASASERSVRLSPHSAPQWHPRCHSAPASVSRPWWARDLRFGAFPFRVNPPSAP